MVFDLQQLFTVECSLIPKLNACSKAILNSPFKEQLVTRLYSYLTRVGTPDDFKAQLCYEIVEAAGLKPPVQNAIQSLGSKSNASGIIAKAVELQAAPVTEVATIPTSQTEIPQLEVALAAKIEPLQDTASVLADSDKPIKSE